MRPASSIIPPQEGGEEAPPHAPPLPPVVPSLLRLAARARRMGEAAQRPEVTRNRYREFPVRLPARAPYGLD